MGHRDSSAQFGGDGGFLAAGGGTHPIVAESGRRGIAPLAPRDVSDGKKSLFAWPLLFLIRTYMILLSPFFGGACKFEPSCSNYAYEAIARHGAARGLALAAKRLLRCRPFTVGGYDPVSETESSEREIAGSSRERGLAQ